MMPQEVISIRRDLCKCEGVNYSDPCAACPNGHFGRYEETGCADGTQEMGLGDRIEHFLNKIPGITSLPCHDQETKQLRPESPCGKAKERLNAGEPIIPTIIKRIKEK